MICDSGHRRDARPCVSTFPKVLTFSQSSGDIPSRPRPSRAGDTRRRGRSAGSSWRSCRIGIDGQGGVIGNVRRHAFRADARIVVIVVRVVARQQTVLVTDPEEETQHPLGHHRRAKCTFS